MGLQGGILWIFWILMVFNTERLFAQTKRSSRIISSRSFGINSKSSSSSNGIDFDCPEEFGYYPHPNDCTQYYVCVFGGALLESCTGGLMYSHELQTCDWPRNVGCEIAEISSSSSVSSSTRDVTPRVPQVKQQQQQQQQHIQVPHRVRFSSLTSSTHQQQQQQQQQLPKQTFIQQQPQHQHRQQQIIQTLPPPPELRIAPNPIITSRGQPKPLSLDAQEDIAKLYAEAHDTLPPAEEEETDRQQRVYRGQPSTVGQVQRDRDGILHQGNLNALPNHGKIGSYAFGSQLNQFSNKGKQFKFDFNTLSKLKTHLNRIKRETFDKDMIDVTSKPTDIDDSQVKNKEMENLTITRYTLNNETVVDNNNSTKNFNETISEAENSRSPRQLRNHLTGRPSWDFGKSSFRSDHRSQINSFRPSLAVDGFPSILSPPSPTSNNYFKSNINSFKPSQPAYFPIPSTRSPNANLPFKPIKFGNEYNFEDSFRPFAELYSVSSTPQPPGVIPLVLTAPKTGQWSKTPNSDQLPDNFSYFHIASSPGPSPSILSTRLKNTVQPNKNTAKSLTFAAFSTIGGFYNNQRDEKEENTTSSPIGKSSKLINAFSVSTEIPIQITTQSNYFAYNILQNQRMKNFYLTSTPNPIPKNYELINNYNNYYTPQQAITTILPPIKVNDNLSLKNTSSKNDSTLISSSRTMGLKNENKFELKNQTFPTVGSDFNFDKFVSEFRNSHIVKADPSIMDVLTYFKQTQGIIKADNKSLLAYSRPITPILLKDIQRPTTVSDYTLNINPLQKKPKLINSTTVLKSYNNLIENVSQKVSVAKPTLVKQSSTTEVNKSEDYYYDDDYNVDPPFQKPFYMPNSETMPPRSHLTASTPSYAKDEKRIRPNISTTRQPSITFHFNYEKDGNGATVPSIVNFPTDIFEKMKTMLYNTTKVLGFNQKTTTPFPRTKFIYATTAKTTTTTTARSTKLTSIYNYTSTPATPTITTKKIYTIRPNRGQSKWKYNKKVTSIQNERKRPVQQQIEIDDKIQLNRVETSSQAPANIFIQQQQRPSKPITEQNTRNYYNTTSNQQSYRPSPYDSYYSVYDDDVELYRDVEYSSEQQQHQQQPQHQQRGKPQQSTYRPEVISTPPAPQVPGRDTYSVNKQQEQYEQPSLVYNTDYDDTLISQLEDDHDYSQPTRNPIRGDRIEINSISDRPIVISSTIRTSNEPQYTPPPPLPPISYAQIPKIPSSPSSSSSLSSFQSQSPMIQQQQKQHHLHQQHKQQQQQEQQSIQQLPPSPPPPLQRMPIQSPPKHIQAHQIEKFNIVATPLPPSDYPPKQMTPPRSTLSDVGINSNKTSKPILVTLSANTGASRSEDSKIPSESSTTPDIQILQSHNRSRIRNVRILNNSLSDTVLTETKTIHTSILPLNKNDTINDNRLITNKTENETLSLRTPFSNSNIISNKNESENDQRQRILGFIVSEIQPQSFQPPPKPTTVRPQITSSTTTTTTTTTTTLRSIRVTPTNQISNDASKASKNIKFNFTSKSFRTSISPRNKNNKEIPLYVRSKEEYPTKETVIVDPTTYTPPIRSWRLTRTSPSPFTAQDTNLLKESQDSLEDTSIISSKIERSNERISSSGSENTPVREKAEVIQSFTTRALVFKDNLNRNFETTGQTKFVSPYKSLETILQDENQSTLKPRYVTTPSPPVIVSSQKPFRSYFLITAPPRNISSVVYPTTKTTLLTSSKSFPHIQSSTTTTSTTTTETPSTAKATFPRTTSTTVVPSTTYRPIFPTSLASPSTRSIATSTTDIPTTKLTPKTILPTSTTTTSTSTTTTTTTTTTSANPTQLLKKDTENSNDNVFRGRLKYTFAYKENSVDLDEPTTYSPKFRFTTSSYDSTSTTPEPIIRRKIIRTRPILSPTVSVFPKTYFDRQQTESQSRFEFAALKSDHADRIPQPSVKYLSKSGKSYYLDENDSLDKKIDLSEIEYQNFKYLDADESSKSPKSTRGSEEKTLEISDRLAEYFNKYRDSSTEKLIKSIENVSDSLNTTYNELELNPKFHETVEVPQVNYIPTESSIYDESSEKDASKEPEQFTELSSSSEIYLPTASLEISKLNENHKNSIEEMNNITTEIYTTTTTETTTTPTLNSTSSTVTRKVTKPTTSYPKMLLPPRVSRVNNAIKTSIAASSRTKATTSAFSKCADNTPNTKCNEIPSRTNNRNRGGAHYTSNDREQPSTASVNRGTHPPRIRPTLKPSGTIIAKASEFVDIYRNPASRPEPLYPQPTPDKTAAKCRKDVCLLPDCYCGGKDIPGDLPVENVPQIVLLTFDDSVNDLNKQLYIDLFEKGRVNPNGCPITATFYVSHEWTDYSQVQNLYADGHEIASHTVSHSFGEQFSQKKWTREVAGQREILAAYGGVKLSDVRGMRAPFLSIGGNKMFKMLYDSNFTYDSSMPVYENRPPSWPYTLDYKIFHDCMIPPCPTKSYPGVWEVPMVMWQDLNGGRCSMGDACSNPSDADSVFKMLMKNFERHYTTNRAPFGLFYHAAWFTQPHHKEGFISFLDTINGMNDVWIVTNWQALQWIRDPTPLSRMNQFQPFQCDYSDRPKRCNNPKVCNLWHKSGVRYMRTCQPCPDIYPWTGKTGIKSSRIDNDIEE